MFTKKLIKNPKKNQLYFFWNPVSYFGHCCGRRAWKKLPVNSLIARYVQKFFRWLFIEKSIYGEIKAFSIVFEGLSFVEIDILFCICHGKSLTVYGSEVSYFFRIFVGEELTYDYKFAQEDDKLPCYCGAKKCRKYMN